MKLRASRHIFEIGHARNVDPAVGHGDHDEVRVGASLQLARFGGPERNAELPPDRAAPAAAGDQVACPDRLFPVGGEIAERHAEPVLAAAADVFEDGHPDFIMRHAPQVAQIPLHSSLCSGFTVRTLQPARPTRS